MQILSSSYLFQWCTPLIHILELDKDCWLYTYHQLFLFDFNRGAPDQPPECWQPITRSQGCGCWGCSQIPNLLLSSIPCQGKALISSGTLSTIWVSNQPGSPHVIAGSFLKWVEYLSRAKISPSSSSSPEMAICRPAKRCWQNSCEKNYWFCSLAWQREKVTVIHFYFGADLILVISVHAFFT